ncbi:MAG: branched-chain amino acid transporter substrate-binding protein, partial [Rhodospirillales bacterium]|nr:branched-chain amino acid transporter substrate-binding protein [Rhodospirillales bacterium]
MSTPAPSTRRRGIAVLNGEAVVRTDDGEKHVGAGETAILDGDGPYGSEVRQGVEHSPFDDWADSRLRVDQAPPPKFVSAETTGYQDLATYGAWQEEPAYGAVWYPRDVPADWAPYRYGHWRSVAPWGWTWVDDSPWGYAPFHYGRWAYVGNRWGWVPGTYVARPVWAPALVAFAAVTAGGPVGWVPLAPREPYRPWYRASPRYLRAVNVTHVTNVTVIQRGHPIPYANRSYATAAPQAVFAHGGPIGRTHEPVDPARFNRAARAPSPVGLRAALPAPAAPQQVAPAAPPPPLRA